jgi:hypothetical protein
VEPDDIAPGTIIAGFNYILPIEDDVTRSQVRVNVARGFQEAVVRRSLTIIANGPTARKVDLRSIKSPTLAVNGAMHLFSEVGISPTYWAACDPQAIVADFLPDCPPTDTIYLVASKCHPSVFEKLNGRDVQVWHVNDHHADGASHIPPSCSITITASWLMHRLGFTDFEYWGWDGCFLDGRHHASNADEFGVPVLRMNFGGTIVDGEVLGGRLFSTTRAWAAEAKGAEQFFNLARYFDIGVRINGDGMFECARQLIMSVTA